MKLMSRTEYYGCEYIDLNGIPHQTEVGKKFDKDWAFYSFNSEPSHGFVEAEDRRTHAIISGRVTFKQAEESLNKYKQQQKTDKKLVSMLERMIKEQIRQDAKSDREVIFN